MLRSWEPGLGRGCLLLWDGVAGPGVGGTEEEVLAPIVLCRGLAWLSATWASVPNTTSTVAVHRVGAESTLS